MSWVRTPHHKAQRDRKSRKTAGLFPAFCRTSRFIKTHKFHKTTITS